MCTLILIQSSFPSFNVKMSNADIFCTIHFHLYSLYLPFWNDHLLLFAYLITYTFRFSSLFFFPKKLLQRKPIHIDFLLLLTFTEPYPTLNFTYSIIPLPIHPFNKYLSAKLCSNLILIRLFYKTKIQKQKLLWSHSFT